MRSTRLLTLTLTCAAAPTAWAGEASERAAAQVLEQTMANQSPQDLALLRAVQGRDIVVVRGSMDHIEEVLAAARIRHTVIEPEQVAAADLNANQVVMVNCPGHMPQAGLQRLEKFVRAGGLLYTTDWALLNVVQKAFPKTIAHTGGSTGNHVTPVRVLHQHDDLMSNMLLTGAAEPQWWLEGGSYPIQILDRQRVEVLAASDQMGKQYGAAPVVVRFRWDDGEVIHVVSHFYRQMDTRGPRVAAKDAIDEVKSLSAAQKDAIKSSKSGEVNMGDLESSYAFQRMTSNLIVTKQKKNAELDKQYTATPAAAVTLEGRKVEKGGRLKVLARDGDKVRVRDDRGNEGEVPADALEAR
jgi:hypothetical protein